MNWWIVIGIYKTKTGRYFILDITEEMKQLGYREEVYEEDSNIFDEDEIKKLDEAEYGYYSVSIRPKDEKFHEGTTKWIDEAKKENLAYFEVIKFIKRV